MAHQELFFSLVAQNGADKATAEALGVPAGPAGAGPNGANGAPPPGGGFFSGPFMFLLLGLLVFMIFNSILIGRKERKRTEEMLNSLAKHDVVQTNGGIIGIISEVKKDRVVLRFDESQARIPIARNAIARVLDKAKSGGGKGDDGGKDASSNDEAAENSPDKEAAA